MKYLMKYFFPAVLIAVHFFLSCTFLGEGFTEAVTREKVYNRKEAVSQLNTGIFANIKICPNHYYAGLYASSVHTPVAARELYYTKDSVDSCMALLALAPCSMDPRSDILIFTNLYVGILRNCGLKDIKNITL